jgi:hypothetical protein
MRQEQDKALVRESFGIVDPQHVRFLASLDQRSEVEPVASDCGIDVGRHAAHAARDHRDTAGDHVGYSGGVQGSSEIGGRRVELAITAAAHCSHPGSAPNGGA